MGSLTGFWQLEVNCVWEMACSLSHCGMDAAEQALAVALLPVGRTDVSGVE